MGMGTRIGRRILKWYVVALSNVQQVQETSTLTFDKSDQEVLALLRKRKPKKEQTRDLMLIFMPHKETNFPDEDGKEHIEVGAWCKICR